MRVAFVSFHCRYHYQSIAGPFLQAATQAVKSDVEWRSFEFLTSSSLLTALNQILDYKPDVVACSTYLWSIELHGKLAMRLRLLLPDAVWVLGGPESWLALEDPKHPLLVPFDVVVVGEAENELPALLDCIEGGEALPRLIRATPIDNLDALPSPYQRGLFLDDAPYLHMETSRGCVNHCTFCTSSRSPSRQYSIERWRDDLGAVLARHKNLARINLLDRSLNEQTGRLISVIDAFLELSDSQILHVEMHPDFMDDEQLTYLKSLPRNRLHVEMGIQSSNKETLASVGRKSDPEQVARIVKTLVGFDSISLHVDLIAGLPKQSHADICDAVDLLCELGPDDIQLERLKLLPGTPIRKTLPGSIVYAPFPPWEVLRTETYSEHDLFESDRLSLLLDRYYSPNYFSRTLRQMAAELGSWTRLWDVLAEKEDAENPTSVEQRFRSLQAIIDEHGLSSKAKERWMFDLLLHGRFLFGSCTASENDYARRVNAIVKTLPDKAKAHIERFDHPIEELPDFSAPGMLFFSYQPGRVVIFKVGESMSPVQTTMLAVSTKGKIERVAGPR